MRYLPLRRLTTLILSAFAIGAVAGLVSWLQLPFEPRASLDVPCNNIIFAADGNRFATCMENQIGGRHLIRIWNAAEFKQTASMPFGNSESIRHMVFSRDGRKIAALINDTNKGDNSWIRVWNAQNGSLIKQISLSKWKEAPQIQGLVFSTHGKLQAVMRHHEAFSIWDVAEKKEVLQRPYPPWLTGVFGKFELRGNNETEELARLLQGQWHLLFQPASSIDTTWILPYDLAVSPGGRKLARIPILSDKPAEVFDTVAGRRTDVCVGATGRRPFAHSLSPVGKYLAISTTEFLDETNKSPWTRTLQWIGVSPTLALDDLLDTRSDVYVYDTTNGQLLTHVAQGAVAVFAPDNRTMAILSVEGLIDFYDLPPRRPWVKILVIGIATATAVFLIYCGGRVVLKKLLRLG